VSERTEAIVRRLVEEVLNEGRMGVIGELDAPAMVEKARD
jgi:hypothetical protein